MASENNSRPVADEEATLDAIILSVQHNGRTSDEMSYLRDIVRAALARQAPAPLSQAVPEGFAEVIAKMHEPMDVDRTQPGYQWRKGWNDALHRVQDYLRTWQASQPQAVTEDARDGARRPNYGNDGPTDGTDHHAIWSRAK